MKYNRYNAVAQYMTKNEIGLDDIYTEIQNKTCKLSKNLRDYVESHYDKEGVFIKNSK